MKLIKHLPIIVLFLVPNWLFGQQPRKVKAIASPLKMNVLYVGVDNPVNVAIPGVGCDELHVEFPQGKIYGSGCSYTVGPLKPGEAYLYIGFLDSGSVCFVDTISFRVKRIPDPTPMFGNRSPINDSVSLAEAKAIPGIYAIASGFDFDVRYQVLEYRVKIIRGNSTIVSHTNSGMFFTQEIEHSFDTELTEGDLLVIDKIRVLCADNTERRIRPLKLIVY